MSILRASRCLPCSRYSSLHPVQYATPAIRRRQSGIILRPFPEKSWRHLVSFRPRDSGHSSEVPTVEILAKLSPTANTLKSQIQHEQELARERQKEKKQKGRLQSNNNTTVILLPDFDGGVGAQPTRKNETHDGDKVGKARDVATDSSTAGVDGEGSYDWNGADAGSGGDCGGSDFFGDVGGCFGDGGG